MKIIHYTLGLYPQRSGGLNRYATDLMREQAKQHDVIALTPGKWKPWSKECSIKKAGNDGEIILYHLINSLPLPLLFGIKTPRDFFNIEIDMMSFELFYREVKPEVLHLHTLQGMPEDVLMFFKRKGVKIIFTSHDYFGICPKVNLINKEGKPCEGPTPERCSICNAKAPSSLFLRMRNSNIALKSRDFVRWLKSSLNF